MTTKQSHNLQEHEDMSVTGPTGAPLMVPINTRPEISRRQSDPSADDQNEDPAPAAPPARSVSMQPLLCR